MRKFSAAYKDKVNQYDKIHEEKIVDQFKKVYNSLLEHHGITSIHDLNEKSQVAFLTEMNQYWSEESGISELGQEFLNKREVRLNENSTPLQKKNFLKEKTGALLSETLRVTDVKYKLYTFIDEMYEQIKADKIEDVLSPEMLSNIIAESFANSLDEFVSDMYNELKESSTEKTDESINESKKPKVYLKKRKK